MLIIFTAFFLLRFFRLGYHNLWYDEIFTLHYVYYPWHNWNAPLYYISLHYWIKFFGVSEFSLRLPSLIFSFFSVYLLYLLGKTLFNKKVGIISSIFIGLSPFHLWYAQEAREYAIILFFGLLSSLLFFIALKDNKVKLWLFFILVSIAGLYTHYFYIFLILAQSLYLLYIRKLKIGFREIVSFFGIALVFSFYLGGFLRKMFHVQRGFWIPQPGWRSLFITLENFTLGYTAAPPIYFISDFLTGVFFIWSLFAVFKKKELRGNFIFCLFLSLLPIGIVFFFSRLLFSVYLDRGLIIFSPYFYLILSIGIGSLAGRIRKIFLIFLVAIMLISDYAYFNDWMVMPNMHHVGIHIKKSVKPIIKFLTDNVGSRDIIGFTNNSPMQQMAFYGKDRFFQLYFFDPRLLDDTWKRPKQESAYCVPFYKIANLNFEKLWVLACDWSRSGDLDENSKIVKQWLDNKLKIEFAKEFDGLWIFRYVRRNT